MSRHNFSKNKARGSVVVNSLLGTASAPVLSESVGIRIGIQHPMTPSNLPRPAIQQDLLHQPPSLLTTSPSSGVRCLLHNRQHLNQLYQKQINLPCHHLHKFHNLIQSLHHSTNLQQDEDFRSHRRRLAQQETMPFGPFRRRREQQQPTGEHGSTPYAEPPSNESANNLEDSPFAFEVEDMEINALPPGWKLENGYITLDDKTRDHWELRAGCLIRHHAIPRRALFDPLATHARAFGLPRSCESHGMQVGRWHQPLLRQDFRWAWQAVQQTGPTQWQDPS